ncbi:preQ(1) synthase [Aneurinibacillus aneurinilyticus]|jgi:7-cyano-7-deazaguanine reductase|uniref:NADPH-dependent 7-cyano-7-deazaguanine reductase n=2 Tax=Aneurinibacillus aneurinilyticus TaxID=1391 RepID=U1WZS7_ANEAE|nr:preQ(1) synthase [Aneurinibacillus aneurinilyticus]ERI08230.1 preQ(1) synthase [Aneurinibacillus aneurinilyticus ATCC 12856]MCI1695129.1 preQ(1) synthase [Aneurinibacillus aneurinilyticus]MED0704609.1 preQ(1) synthase [Aneurinibacillus aneurinilyticus]MED0721541.1 preQ(1) synthase [Aneurinibacillus aneurinilyticus]MED0734809.1 preQ(1) synthase [Aneurinibacillus aneurinilyticus]
MMSQIQHDYDKYNKIRFDTQDRSAIMEEILETIPYEYVGKKTEVTIPTNEFTSVCPWSGLPDFADIKIIFIPNEKLIEMKSLKFYLTSYRNVGIYQEHVTNKILEDLVKVAEPLYMRVEALWNARGGLGTEVVVEYRKEGYEG